MDTQWGSSGQLLAFGYLKFFEAGGATTPKHVYGESDLSTDNGVRVDLTASGRPEVDVWGSGAYFVELYDSDDVKQGEADDVEIPGGDATAIPVLDSGEFLTGDGANLLAQALLLIPDPTGHAGDKIGTDGTTIIWEEPDAAPTVPTLPADGVLQTATSFTIGKFMVQTGTATASASGSATTTASVTFPTTYTTCLYADISINTGGEQSGGAAVAYKTSAASGSGFTAKFDVAEGSGASPNFGTAVGFSWIAFGIIP
jgi:hypothetical protein